MKNFKKRLEAFTKEELIQYISSYTLMRHDSCIADLEHIKVDRLLKEQDKIIAEQIKTREQFVTHRDMASVKKLNELERKYKKISKEIDGLLNIKAVE